MNSAFIQAFNDLPETLAVFPLPGVVLFPGAQLPLNIFEPRYLDMVQDALRGNRLIGMLQPSDEQEPPALQHVGCAGRITGYQETADGRFEIVLTGVCRFAVQEELHTARAYRLVQPDWSPFAADYAQEEADPGERRAFLADLRGYLEREEISLDWDVLEELPSEPLVSSLAMALPLGPADKQTLLEAPDLHRRLRLFHTLLSAPDAAPVTRH